MFNLVPEILQHGLVLGLKPSAGLPSPSTRAQSHRSPHSVRGKLQPHCLLSVTTLSRFSLSSSDSQIKWWQNYWLVDILGIMQTRLYWTFTSACGSENSLSTQQPLLASTFLPLLLKTPSTQIFDWTIPLVSWLVRHAFYCIYFLGKVCITRVLELVHWGVVFFLGLIKKLNIARGETSQAITPFHFFD